MDKQPTEAQIKEFWEWCGLPHQGYGSANRHRAKSSPPIDLNNLFKYAVPKLQDLGEIAFCLVAKGWRVFIVSDPRVKTPHIKSCHSEDIYEDPALALFWAIWEVIHNER